MKEKVEKLTGAAIPDDEYQRAVPPAKSKLYRINQRDGTNHGEEYLAMLIYEQVLFSLTSNFCYANHRVLQAEKKTNALQRDTPAHRINNYTPRGILYQEV